MTDEKGVSGSADTLVPDEEHVFVCPASPTQAALWFLDRLGPGRATYNIPTAFLIDGPVDWRAFERAVNRLVERHESLRTTFATENEQPVQVIRQALSITIPHTSVESHPEPLSEAHRLAAVEATIPFDLSRGPLIRAHVFVAGPTRHVLVLTVHHIISDGWSQAILLRELSALYESERQQKPSELEPVALQYADFCAWQEKRLTPELLERQAAYWSQQLIGAPDLVSLPSDQPGHLPPSGACGCVWGVIPEDETLAIRRFCSAQGVSLFMFLVAVLDVLVARHSGTNDVSIGAPAAGRNRPELEHAVGFFATTITVRTRLDGTPTFREVLERVKAAALEAYDHQDIPFAQVVEAVKPDRGSGEHTPLFQVMCAVIQGSEHSLTLTGTDIIPIRVHNGSAKFDWLWAFDEYPTSINVAFEFSRDLCSDGLSNALMSRFRVLTTAAVRAPETPIADLPLYSPSELDVIRSWNPSMTPRHKDATVLVAFRAQAAATPNAVAITDGRSNITYQALAERANRLARYLRRRGVGRSERVALCLERGSDLMVAVLGTLTAGAAYVPLDPSYPHERLRLMVEDADVRVIVVDRASAEPIVGDDERALVLADHAAAIAQESPAPLDNQPTTDDTCYLMYTSGSTGRPKGVMMPHGPLANLIDWQVSRSAKGLTTLQYGSPSFDVSFQEIFATWTSGGRLVLVSESERREPTALLKILDSAKVERLFLPFVALQVLTEAAVGSGAFPMSLREVITAGEQLRITPAVRFFFSRLADCRLDNQYGPTESHVVTAHLLEGEPQTWPPLPPIGRPIANARVHLLDSALHRVPPSVAADIWIGGGALADGYWRRPDLTAERFRTITIDGRPERVYQSGDRGVYLADGTIEFLGRSDDQLKVRGYRVEPAEVEAVLEELAEVQQAVVVAVHGSGGAVLHGFYVGTPGVTSSPEAIRDRLRDRLPDYLIPAGLYVRSSMPVTPSGKIDRRRLAQEVTELPSGVPLATPTNRTEELLTAIWKDLLGIDRIGINDDFFHLGGHSLLSVRLMTRIEAEFGVALPLSTLFRAPTIAKIGVVIDRTRRGDERESDQWRSGVVIRAGDAPTLFYVHTLSGDIEEIRGISQHLTTSQQIVGIQAQLTGDIASVYGTLESTAALYVTEIRRVQPSGPYLLIGWSSGGTLALEIAQQLWAAGQKVDLLGIIDSAPFNVEHVKRRSRVETALRLVANVPAWIRDDLMETSLSAAVARLNQKALVVGRRLGRLVTNGRSTVRDVVNFPRRGGVWETFAEIHYAAIRSYKPCRYPGHVSLFTAMTHPLTWLNDPVPAWTQLAASLDVYPTAGTHFSIVKEPNVRVLAGAIDKAITDALDRSRAREQAG